MMRSIRWLSIIITGLAVLCVYSFAVYRTGQGAEFRYVSKPVKSFSTFPATVKNVFKSYALSGVPPTYVKADSSFEEVNKLEYDLYALNSFWNMEKERWDIRLFNFRTDEIFHEWKLDKDKLDFSHSRRQFPNAEVRNCLLTGDRSIIAVNDDTPNMTRLDAESNIYWQNQEMVYHHSLNFDADSSIWVCGSPIPEPGKSKPEGGLLQHFDGSIRAYREDFIVKIDKETGEILYKKGVAAILLENGFKNFVYGMNNPAGFENDPIHLNDIQPVLSDGPYWKKGDLFLSIRHRSLVLLYRPSSNQILRLIYGPLLNQHDIDVLTDSTISIFNNNVSTSSAAIVKADVDKHDIDRLLTSEVMIYNFADSSFSKVYDQYMQTEGIFTETQGFQEILSNGDIYVEEENSGKMYVIGSEGFVLKKTFATPIEDYIERPNWIRIFENLNLN